MLSKRRKTLIRDLLVEIQSISYIYKDPVTDFVEAVFEQFSFDDAKNKLTLCYDIMKHDFFLSVFADQFKHEGRIVMCEILCTISRRVDITTLSEKLELTEDETEKWIVDMIRGASGQDGNLSALDIRIDSSGKQIIMSPPSVASSKVIYDRTNDIIVRSNLLNNNLEQLLNDQSAYLKQQKLEVANK
jgi:translation initiation factor 3 subunit E